MARGVVRRDDEMVIQCLVLVEERAIKRVRFEVTEILWCSHSFQEFIRPLRRRQSVTDFHHYHIMQASFATSSKSD
jgi:hypothetical protein